MTIIRTGLGIAAMKEVLDKGQWGVLSTISENGQPYGVPLHYVYDHEKNMIYCHCSPGGQKVINIRNNPNVSFNVVGEWRVLEDAFISNYKSVIITGTATIYEDGDQMRRPLELLCAHLAPTTTDKQRQTVIDRYLKLVRIIAITIKEMTGKENRDT